MRGGEAAESREHPHIFLQRGVLHLARGQALREVQPGKEPAFRLIPLHTEGCKRGKRFQQELTPLLVLAAQAQQMVCEVAGVKHFSDGQRPNMGNPAAADRKSVV